MKNPFEATEGVVADDSSPPSPTKSEGSPPSVTHCTICAQAGSLSSDDPLLVCVDCSVGVHFSCYGQGVDGANGWRCRWCASSSKKTKACVFCPFTEGAFVRYGGFPLLTDAVTKNLAFILLLYLKECYFEKK